MGANDGVGTVTMLEHMSSPNPGFLLGFVLIDL
jgi:hypothetical protein